VTRTQWCAWLVLVASCVLLSGRGAACARAQSASEYMDSLRSPWRRPAGGQNMSCGQVYEDSLRLQRAARSLAALGPAANPELGRAIDSLENDGERSGDFPGAGWIFMAYAWNAGRSAYPRLCALAHHPAFANLTSMIDSAIAVSLNLTSYVSGPHGPLDVFTCYRPEEPRDALDKLIVAWDENDTAWLAEHLGPQAETALATLREKTDLAGLRPQFSRGVAATAAIGYRFEVPGPWSQPWAAEPLEEAWGKVDARRFPKSTVIDTFFTDGAGRTCGEHLVEFTRRGGPLEYTVDAPDLGGLLRVLKHCATQSESQAR